jgi:hypothetical protein
VVGTLSRKKVVKTPQNTPLLVSLIHHHFTHFVRYPLPNPVSSLVTHVGILFSEGSASFLLSGLVISSLFDLCFHA